MDKIKYSVHEGSISAHCCFTASVVDNGTEEPICECFESADAHKICDALNTYRG